MFLRNVALIYLFLKHFQNWDLLIKQLKMQEKTDLL